MKAYLAIRLLSLALVGLNACGGSSSGPSSASNEAGAKYPIVLQRDEEPGKAYRVRVKDESSQTVVTRSAGKVVKEEKEAKLLSFVGTRKVLSAGKHQPTEYVVEELSRLQGGQKQEPLPPGTTILGSPAGKEWQYSVNGQPVAEDLSKALRTLLGGDINDTGDDDVFGSKEPRAVGERWDIDIAKLPVEEEFAIDPEGASGSTRVVALRNVEGVECLEIEAELNAPKVELKTMPPESKVSKASMIARFFGLFPTDTKLPSLSKRMTMDLAITVEVSTPNGPVEVDLTMHSEQSMNRE